MQVTPIDRPALISLLPGFLFFTTSLIASSKALAGVHTILIMILDQAPVLSMSRSWLGYLPNVSESGSFSYQVYFPWHFPLQVPIPVYVSVLNSLPTAVYLLDRLAPAGSQVISSVDIRMLLLLLLFLLTCRLSGQFLKPVANVDQVVPTKLSTSWNQAQWPPKPDTWDRFKVGNRIKGLA